MKKISLILSLLLFPIALILSQDPSQPSVPSSPDTKANEDTTRFKLGDTQFLIIGKKEQSDDDNNYDDDEDSDLEKEGKINRSPSAKDKKRKSVKVDLMDLDLGWNFLINDGAPESKFEDLRLKNFRSWSFTFNFLPTEIYLGTKKAMVMTAFGWRTSQHEFKNKVEFIPNQHLQYNLGDTAIVKTELISHYLQLPVMLYFQTKKLPTIGRLGIGFGGYAGILVHQESEVKYQNFKRTIETEEDFGFNPYRYGISGRMDIGYISLFANYDLNNNWKDNNIKNLECGLWLDF